MSSLPRVVLACALLAGAQLVWSGCSHDPAAPDDRDDRDGRIELSLTGRAASGAVYRLRDAEIAVSPGGPVFHTEDDPDRASITAFLDAGAYALIMSPGWRLERVAGGVAETVPAELTSPNPRPFEVRTGEVTPLALRFHVGTQAGQGAIDITLEVDEDAPDAGVPDAGVPDATPAPLQRVQAVTSRIEVPGEANTSIKLDIDGDGRAENALGKVLSALISQSGGSLDLQGELDRAVAHGEIIQLDRLETGGPGGPTAARLTTYDGADPSPSPCADPGDTVCGRHLQGGASFHVAATSPTDSDIAGTLVGGRFIGGPGVLRLRLSMGAGVLALRLVSARADLAQVGPGGIVGGIVGGALTVADINAQVIPYLAVLIEQIVSDECRAPTSNDCGCAAGTGHTLLSLFDRFPRNCAISVDELRSSPFVQTLLGPDLDLDHDKQNDALSVAVRVTAVPAVWPE